VNNNISMAGEENNVLSGI